MSVFLLDTEYAKASKEEMPIIGFLKTSVNAFIVDKPILIPVNDPGPISQANASISFNFILLFSIHPR